MAARTIIWNRPLGSGANSNAWTGSSLSSGSRVSRTPTSCCPYHSDEEAVAGWRSRAGHRDAQSAGRKGILRDYRLRVAAVVRDYGMSKRREQAPADSRAIYEASD